MSPQNRGAQILGAAISGAAENLRKAAAATPPTAGKKQDAMPPVHEAAELFPLLDGQAFSDLVENIRRFGLREPVVMTVDGKLLDGRNRYRACLEAGVEPKSKTFRGPGKALQYVISANLHRRHLTTSQRSMIAAKLATLEQGARTDLTQNCGMSQSEASEQLKVSVRSTQSAKKVLDDGTPELVEAVRDGVISVGAATEVATLPREDQREAVKKIKKGAKPAAVTPKKDTPKKEQKPIGPPSVMGPKLEIPAFLEKVKPIVAALFAEGRKNMATMSPPTVGYLTFQLAGYLERLTRDTTPLVHEED